jgi:hypothetical protein
MLLTIYAFIYRAAQKAEQLWRYLARRHKCRQALDRIRSVSKNDPSAMAIR